MNNCAKLYSFDVFDTALMRQALAPSEVFRLIAHRIIGCGGFDPRGQFVDDFASARLAAERRCYHRCQSEETSLAAIWHELRGMLPDFPETCGARCELDAEEAVICANPLVAERIRYLRKKDLKIAFISDTYLPADFVRAQLAKHGLWQEGDACYVSSEVGATKSSGNLFRHVLAAEGIPPRSLIHFGDNPRSDVKVPRSIGIKAQHCGDTTFNRWEKALLRHPLHHQGAERSLALAMRSARLEGGLSAANSPVHQLVGTFIGPVVTVWAAWALATARRRGVNRMYFAARDGFLAWRAARILAPYFGDIDCRYLKISRQSIHLPATDQLTAMGMPWLDGNELCSLIAQLGFSWSELGPAFCALAQGEGAKKRLRSKGEWAEFWKILEGAEVAERIHARIRERRADALSYLRQEGLGDNRPAAIVDLGWGGTVQSALHKLFNASAGTLEAYYLGMQWDRVPVSESGPVIALVHQPPPDLASVSEPHPIFRRYALLESTLGFAPHGRVVSYRRQGSAMEANCTRVSDEHCELVSRISYDVEKFVTGCRFEAKLYGDEDAARSIIDKLVRAWFSEPCRIGIEILGRQSVALDPNDFGMQPLIEPWGIVGALLASLPWRWRRACGIQERFWPEASLMKTGMVPGALLRLRRAGVEMVKNVRDLKGVRKGI